MKTIRNISGALALFAFTFLTGCGGEIKRLQAENEALRAEVAELKARAEADAQANSGRAAELKHLQSDAQDAARLRGEVTQLRSSTKDGERLRAENQQLKTENQKLRGTAAAADTPPEPAPAATPDVFPRESWTFAGYTSPEAALVSAIWSMQQGNPKQYFESLTPEEQLRMTKTWEGKSPEEIAAKHQNDTAKITGMRVLNQQVISPDEVQMNIFIDGVDRAEKVSLKKVGNDWKFGGYIREPKP
ncbi:MAG TPA: hypothetical protein VK846_09255 [Candidatus Limnocylindria bacterium]|nr:hypothetical protein [Candidatus Limnocylindria bacterium]